MEDVTVLIVSLVAVIVGLAQLVRSVLSDSMEQRDDDADAFIEARMEIVDLKAEIRDLKFRLNQLSKVVKNQNKTIQEYKEKLQKKG